MKTKLSTREVCVPHGHPIIRPEGAKIIGLPSMCSYLIPNSTSHAGLVSQKRWCCIETLLYLPPFQNRYIIIPYFKALHFCSPLVALDIYRDNTWESISMLIIMFNICVAEC